MVNIQLVVGLGNPGPQYEPTRHNAGFWFVDEAVNHCGDSFRPQSRVSSELARCLLDGRECRLQKPMTFMNHSGQAVGELARFFKIPADEILIVHDELDLPPGTIRLKQGGGHGGHNGLRDIISHLGGKEFYRLRIGIGHPGHRDQVVDYVLNKPSKTDRSLMDDAISAALNVLPDIVQGKFQQAMHTLHSRS